MIVGIVSLLENVFRRSLTISVVVCLSSGYIYYSLGSVRQKKTVLELYLLLE